MHDYIRWSLGEGKISFWDDVWLGANPIRSLCVPGNDPPQSQAVVSYWHEHAWDEDMLQSLSFRFGVPPDVIDQIRATPIELGAKDVRRWSLTSHGEFSVTSAWESIRTRLPKKEIFWLIWNQGLTPAISVFIWRLLFGRLPVDEKLQRRGFELASRCQCCRSPSVESLSHVTHHLHVLVLAGKITSTHWRGCSPLVDFMPFSPRQRVLRSLMVLWHPPNAPWVKLNTDGAFSTSTMEAGEGGVVRGPDGGLLRAFCAPIAVSLSFEAELLALIRGFEMAMELSTHIWIELDSAALVTLLSSGQLDAADFRHHMALIRSMTAQRHVRFSHIYREGNRAADFLAGRGVQTPAFTYYDPTSAPRFLQVLVRMD
ncbi:uncharacterized protein LOC121764049 [Salvia splendens]|uniref:uncharacterized protein LOC121764049 n=1 Tax=Salvia splendens TaxID=180675 RepID=UPI001C2742A2|nr:uncharacterized protein LOC121764049 [Salvia splendens]